VSWGGSSCRFLIPFLINLGGEIYQPKEILILVESVMPILLFGAVVYLQPFAAASHLLSMSSN